MIPYKRALIGVIADYDKLSICIHFTFNISYTKGLHELRQRPGGPPDVIVVILNSVGALASQASGEVHLF